MKRKTRQKSPHLNQNHITKNKLHIRKIALLLSLVSITAFADTPVPGTIVSCYASGCEKPSQKAYYSLTQLKNALSKGQAVMYQTVYQVKIQGKNHSLFLEPNYQQFQKTKPSSVDYFNIDETAITANDPEIIGFGGAFTDASAILFNNMPEKLKQTLINEYYGENGLQYSLGRVPMASTDFSCRDNSKVQQPSGSYGSPSLSNCSASNSTYTYDDIPGDVYLKKFHLQPEDDEKAAMINRANKLLIANSEKPLTLFASVWSAPKWMKLNNSMTIL